MSEKLDVYSVTVSATRSELDPFGTISDDQWSEAWRRYEALMTEAVLSVFPTTEVGVVEQASVYSLQVGEANGREDEAVRELLPAIESAYEHWTESL